MTVRLELLRSLIGAKFAIGDPIRELCDEKARLAELAGDASEIVDSYLSLSLYYGSTGALSLSRSLMQAAADLAERGPRHRHAHTRADEPDLDVVRGGHGAGPRGRT